jgi:hypothetical protein
MRIAATGRNIKRRGLHDFCRKKHQTAHSKNGEFSLVR